MKIVKFFLFILIYTAILIYGIYLFSLNNSIGSVNNFCDKFDEISIGNELEMSISRYTIVCTTLGTSIQSYIHIHKKNQVLTKETLVFSYHENNSIQNTSIVLEWTDRNNVSIEAFGVNNIVNIKTKINGISIDYKIK